MVDQAELEICRRRGHDIDGATNDGKWRRCKLCGISVRESLVVEEREIDPPQDQMDLGDMLALMERTREARWKAAGISA